MEKYLDIVDDLRFTDTIKAVYKLRSQIIERRLLMLKSSMVYDGLSTKVLIKSPWRPSLFSHS